MEHERSQDSAWRDAAERHGFSSGAVLAMARALEAGAGGMAQFDHPEFGGMGQWFSGGMVMLGAVNDHALKARVAALCEDLARHHHASGSASSSQSQSQSWSGASGFASRASRWWPEGLGHPSTSGAQNATRYAVFPESGRLAVETGGRVALYDTGGRVITGVSQAQGGTASLRFSGPDGAVDLDALRRVASDEAPCHDEERRPRHDSAQTRSEARASASPGPAPSPSIDPAPRPGPAGAPPPHGQADPLTILERLAELHRKGVLTEAEFTAKKTELLARI